MVILTEQLKALDPRVGRLRVKLMISTLQTSWQTGVIRMKSVVLYSESPSRYEGRLHGPSVGPSVIMLHNNTCNLGQ
jgi:hypothetical protein